MGELFDLQKSFTEHLRNPDHVPVPRGLDERRMGIYSELIFNNVSSLLSDFFPVIYSILAEEDWDRMVRDFFVSHQSQTPYFMELSGEFSQYLAGSQLLSDFPGYLTELAHYEWIELALFTMDEELPEDSIGTDQLLDVPLSLSPLAQPIAYQYPVHRISPEFQPGAPGDEPTCLLVLRDGDDSVRFFELQLLSFQLLHEIQQNPGLIVRDWLSAVSDEINSQEKSQFVSNGLTLLQSFNEHRIFIEE